MPRVIVITGTSAGVGRATARAFTREGAHIGLIARGADALKACRREVDAAGGRALVLRADVADAAAVEAAAEAVEQQLGPIDVWVNCAMTSVFSPVKQMTADEFKRVTDVAYLGYVYSTLSALRRMLPRDRGVILQVGSALAYRCIPLQSAYCAAKHAIHGFCDSLRSELIHDRSRVRVCMLQMPALNTPQFGWVKSRLPHKAQPVPPIYQPEVAADAIVYASHHPRREFYVGWPAMQAIVGDKLIPGLLDQLPGEHRLQRTADRRARGSGPSGQSLDAGAWRSGRPRQLRRAGTRLQPAVLGEPASCMVHGRWWPRHGRCRNGLPDRSRGRPVRGRSDRCLSIRSRTMA